MMVLRDADFVLAGRWLVQPTLYRITIEDTPVPVGPKVMEVLVYLAERPGDSVSREELMAAVWPDTYVVEEALTRCISELRKLFGDSWQHPTVIETLRNVGYRLLVTVEPVAPKHAAPLTSRISQTNHNLRWIITAVGVLLVAAFLGYTQPWSMHSTASSITWQPVPVTHYPGVEQDAAFSPDGQHVAFVWDGNKREQAHIYIQRVGDATPQQLTHGNAADRHPAWSPDGQEVAFMRYAQDSCTLLAASVATQTLRTLASCTNNHIPDLAWSPDGRWLAYSTYTQPHGPHRIVLLDAASGSKRLLTAPPISRYGDYAPVFSPDGASVAFTRMAFEEANDLYVIPLGGGEAKRLTHQNRLVEGATWTPDSRSLLFASNVRGTFDLWHVALDGSAPQWLAGDTEDVLFPILDPTGSRVLFEHFTTEPNVWHMSLTDETHAMTPLITSSHWDVAPHIGPDGRIAFASNRSGYWAIWIAQPDGSNPRPVTPRLSSIVGAPRWSPDGSHIAFDARPDGHTDVHVLDVTSEAITRVTTLPSDDWAPTWSQDSNHLYFASDRSGTWQIWRTSLSNNTTVQVTTEGGMFAQEAPDGKHLYVARNDVSGLWQQPIAGGTPRLLFEDLTSLDWGNWAISDSNIYFIRRTPQTTFIARYDTTTETVTDVAPTHTPTPWQLAWSQPAFTIAHTGTRLLFTQIDRRESDLLMVKGVGI